MNLKGRLVHSLGVEKIMTITEAVVTSERISLDWNQDGQDGHLIAKSANGSHFAGRYRLGHQNADYDCELTLYRAKHEDLLYGSWSEHGSELAGTLIIRLPVKAVEAPSPGPLYEYESALVESLASVNSRSVDEIEGVRAQAKGEPRRLLPETSTKTPSAARAPAASSDEATTSSSKQPAQPISSAQIDHLLALTPEQLQQRDRSEIEKELSAAPVSALFKAAHNAFAADLRAIAAQMFADRYGGLPASSLPAATHPSPKSAEMKALKRRSSRHGKSR